MNRGSKMEDGRWKMEDGEDNTTLSIFNLLSSAFYGTLNAVGSDSRGSRVLRMPLTRYSPF